VQCGIDSISVNNDAVVRTRQLVASFEKKLILKRLSEIREKISRQTTTKAELPEQEWTFEWED
jgi:predicted DNA-binding protein YlxM (UPF0122 family)